MLLCLLLSGVVLLLEARGELDRAELWTIDRRFQARGPRLPSGQVVVIGIDDASLQNMEPTSGGWPWPRSVYARLIDRLTAAGARVVALDLLLLGEDHHTQGPANDRRLAEAMRRSGRTLLAIDDAPPPTAAVAAPLQVDAASIAAADLLRARSAKLPAAIPPWLRSREKALFWGLPPLELTRAAAGVGYVDLDSDPDGVFRRIQPLRAVDTGRLYAHLGIAAAALGVSPGQVSVDPHGNVRLGNRRTVPVDADGRLLIDFAGGATRQAGEGRREQLSSAFPYYSFSTVVDPQGRVPLSAFRGKVVFVGAAAKGLNDVRPTPFGQAWGVEISANVADAALAGRLLRPPAPSDLPLVMLALAAFLCLALTARTPAAATWATLAVGVLYLSGAFALFEHEVVLPVAAPMATLAACYTGVMTLRFATEQRERRRVRRFLERYVTREVADRVLDDPEAAQMGGRRREVTMLFSDIRGFTSMSEKLSAEVVIEILNEYFGVMVPIIERHGGTTNNFIGDAIFAFWGAPLAQADQAERAVLTALEMLEAMPALQTRWREQDIPPFEIGIGIHLGSAVIGNIGTERRSHYTAIGDDVNIASRLESANSREGTKFLISDAVYARVAELIEARRLPPLSVKNKAEPLTVYEVLGRKGSGSGVQVFGCSGVREEPESAPAGIADPEHLNS